MNKRRFYGLNLAKYAMIGGALVLVITIPALITLGSFIGSLIFGSESPKDSTAFILKPVSGNKVVITSIPAEAADTSAHGSYQTRYNPQTGQIQYVLPNPNTFGRRKD